MLKRAQSAIRTPKSEIANRPVVAAVGISHPDRVLFPEARVTKLGLAQYYESIAAWFLPHVVDRPLTLVCCPTGVGRGSGKRGQECFFMKHSKVWAPKTIRRVRIKEKTKIGDYLIADSLSAVVGLVQMDILEIHTWNSRFTQLEQPDRIVVDLDPGDEVEWRSIVAAARLVRELLMVLGLESFVKTTGGRGLHVVVPLTPSADWSLCLDFARAFAQSLVRRQPEMFTERFGKAERQDKILIDYLRNNRTNTSIAAYSTRARPSAPISVPLAWSELSPARPPARFTIHTVPARLGRLRSDPWKDYWRAKQRLSAKAAAALEGM